MKNTNNILVINNDTESVIKYNKSEINNRFVKKVDLKSLFDIFKENADDIFSYDTSDCFSFILQNGSEISLHEYKIGQHSPFFIKISNDDLTKQASDIIIFAKGNISPNQLQWYNETNNYYVDLADDKTIKEKALKNLNGYQNTIKTINLYQDLNLLPAIRYCYERLFILGGLKYQGYLPSIGQLDIIIKYIDLINHILQIINCKRLDFNNLWSSTYSERNNYWYWTLIHRVDIIQIHQAHCNQVLPLFKKI